MQLEKLNEQYDRIMKILGSSGLLEEGYKDKVKKIEKTIGRKLSNIEEVLIKKFESRINWSKVKWDVLKYDSGYGLLYMLDPDSPSIESILENEFLESLDDYLLENSEVYKITNDILHLVGNDFKKRYKGRTSAFPDFDSAVFAEVYEEIKDDPNFGNIMKIYERKAKEMVSTESEFGGKNKWVILKGGDQGSKEFEKKSVRQKALSSKKTSWCVRGQAGCNYYPNDDFHFYLDEDGDAIISLRFSGEKLDEVSGTNSDQSLTDEEKQIASDYIFKEKKFTNLNEANVKRRLAGYINPPKPEKFKDKITDWARLLYKVKLKGEFDSMSLHFGDNNNDDVLHSEDLSGKVNLLVGNASDEEISELLNYIRFTNPAGARKIKTFNTSGIEVFT